jgi:hypothetical protein
MVGLLFFIPHLLLNVNAVDFLNHNLLSSWNIFNFLKSDFNTIDGRSQYMFPNLVYTVVRLFHPGYFVAGVFFLAIAIFKHKFLAIEKIMMFSVLAYFVFLMGAPFQNSRFFIIAMPLLVVTSFFGYCFLMDRIKFNKYLIFSFIVTLQLVLFWQSAQVFFQRNKLELSISEYIKTNTASKNIYSFDMDVSLKTYISDRNIIGLYAKVHSSFEHNSLVLFNEKLFSTQWSQKNPMLNWYELTNNYMLVSIKKFENGWQLYEIK